VGVTRPWKKSKTRTLPPTAYPRVISNLGNINSVKSDTYEHRKKMIKFLFHFSTSIYNRQKIIEAMSTTGGFELNNFTRGSDLSLNHYLCKDDGTPLDLSKYLEKMYDYVPVGISNTLGYAHHNSGDTMTSVMIGGLRTVMNVDFDIFAGDLVQWYWTFESNCFHTDGSRKKIADAAGTVASNADPEVDYQLAGPVAPALPHDPRRIYNDYQYGVGVGKSPADKCKHVARIKPYIRDDDQPRLYDWVRVFGVALSSARKNEMVDIKIGRQSM